MGLDNFRSDNSSDDSETEATSEEQPYGIDHQLLGSLSVRERIEHIRENHIDDYYPSAQLDDNWSYKRAARITCVCDEEFTIVGRGRCPRCGTKYKDNKRTVVKL